MKTETRSREWKSDYEVYISNDGIEFTDLQKCRNHEYMIVRNNIQIKEFLYPFFDEFYFVENEDVLNWLIGSEFNGNHKTINGKEIEVGDWVTCKYDYDPNGPNEYFLITVEEIKNTFTDD